MFQYESIYNATIERYYNDKIAYFFVQHQIKIMSENKKDPNTKYSKNEQGKDDSNRNPFSMSEPTTSKSKQSMSWWKRDMITTPNNPKNYPHHWTCKCDPCRKNSIRDPSGEGQQSKRFRKYSPPKESSSWRSSKRD
ncbi:hypothetical protein BLOT_012707 [Blomia tropicalis]|nr:hypothetical protein BLOT_012707 [Blomia tropicalis]